VLTTRLPGYDYDFEMTIGWPLYDDTDSGSCLGKAWLDLKFPTERARKAWWKLW